MREKDALWRLNKHSYVSETLNSHKLLSGYPLGQDVFKSIPAHHILKYWLWCVLSARRPCSLFSLLHFMSSFPWLGRLFDTSKGLFLTSCHAADLPHPTGLTPRGRKKAKKKKKLVTWPSAPCPRPPPPCWQQKVCWSEANARNSTRHRHRHRSLGWHDTHASARGKKLRLAPRVFADQKGKCD